MIITVAEAKAHLNITEDDDDTLITAKIDAAERHLEDFTGKAFLTQTLTAKFDGFGAALTLPRSPVQSITSITYLDADRAEQTLDAADYFAHPLNGEQRTVIYPAKGKSFPSTAAVAGAVEVTYSAGYGDADDVPDSLKEAELQLVAHLYENREATLVGVSITDISPGLYELVAAHREWEF